MRLVHSIAVLAIATGVAAISDVNAASPAGDTLIAESKGNTAKGGRADGAISKGTDAKSRSKSQGIQQQMQMENQRAKSAAPK